MTRRPTPEEVGEPDLNVAGLQLWIHGRERPDATDYYDGNWLMVTAHCGASRASVWVSGAILMATDLARWSRECEALRDGQVQQAELNPPEPELRISIQRIDRHGHFRMRVEITPDHLRQAHSFDFEIDQTYLPAIERQCRSILATYQTRGEETRGV